MNGWVRTAQTFMMHVRLLTTFFLNPFLLIYNSYPLTNQKNTKKENIKNHQGNVRWVFPAIFNSNRYI
jgi:TRAP-type mannitol/chloroaromatic compound transport system permease small subunit